MLARCRLDHLYTPLRDCQDNCCTGVKLNKQLTSSVFVKNCTGLKQAHQLLSGLFISSESDGGLAESLDFLLAPKHIENVKVDSLEKHLIKDLLMCKFRNGSTGEIEWCLYRHKNSIEGELMGYALSGLCAFPLPMWPFFGKNNSSLNVFNHFMEYLSSYHPSLALRRPSLDSINIAKGNENLFVSYNRDHTFLFSVFSRDSNFLGISLYRKDFGSCVINGGSLESLVAPIKRLEQLDPLQYEGNVQFLQFKKLTLNHSFSSSFCLYDREKLRKIAEHVLDCVIDLVGEDLSSFAPEKSMQSILSATLI